MGLAYWFVPILLLLVAVAVILLAARMKISLRKWLSRHRPHPVANASRLARLTSYQRKVALLHKMLLVVLVLTLAGGSLALVLAGRYSAMRVEQPEVRNRDIVLCLDASSSMARVDREVVDVFGQLVDKFKGQRISVVLFDSSAMTYFPLINDYGYAKERLAELQRYFDGHTLAGESGKVGLIADAVTEREGGSLIGDGVMSCAMRFDNQQDTKRARSIILATDNQPSGTQIVSLPQAAAYALDRNIRLYSINPSDDEAAGFAKNLEARQLHDATLKTGGDYHMITNPNLVSDVVDKITAQDETRFKGSPIVHINDQPEVFLAVSFGVFAALLLAAWRLRL